MLKTVESNLSTILDQQLATCTPNAKRYPTHVRVHGLVSGQAKAAPERLALADCTSTWTYRDLEARSNHIAHALQELGVGPDVLVGLCVDRSPMMVAGALAILKAGGAYLPLDPTYPQERLAFMLEDAKPQVVLAQKGMVQKLRQHAREVIAVDPYSENAADFVSSAPVELGDGNSLAYVIYTSGSTGQPKGVMITHESLLNLIFWHQNAFGVSADDRVTQLASPGFDAAVWEVWPYLTAGAGILFPGEPTRSQPDLLRNFIVNKEITISFVPTPLAERMLHLEWPTKGALRFMLTGADTLHHFPPANLPFTLVNNYGPTECTVVATSGIVMSQIGGSSLPTIGRPIANTRVCILDSQMREVPIGSPGEIYIGGAGLARGYLNRPDLTSERFVPNPLEWSGGTRLYKTGDLAKCLSDGQIEFIGRVDDQVKIRGFRIELNEIVGVLNRHPAVEESIVTAPTSATGERRLVAHIVCRPDKNLSNADLRSFLGRELPDYMVPSLFVRLDFLPIGPNGKVDRSALPPATDENILRDEMFVAARTPTEQMIACIISGLLGLESIGVNDNFFLLGGNSLFGTQVIARLRETFDVEVSLLGLFDNPTVAGLATEVEGLLYAKVDSMSENEIQHLEANNAREGML